MSIENIEKKEQEILQASPLELAYAKIHEKECGKLQEWEVAKRVVEVLDDPNWIDSDLAKECVYAIVHEISYPDDETKKI